MGLRQTEVPAELLELRLISTTVRVPEALGIRAEFMDTEQAIARLRQLVPRRYSVSRTKIRPAGVSGSGL